MPFLGVDLRKEIPAYATVREPTCDIALDDPDAWRLHPRHRWVFNKLAVAETQDIRCGPFGLAPDAYPVFQKPFYNLNGCGMQSRMIHSREEYDQHFHPGTLWMEVAYGEHLSHDFAVIRGNVCWSATFRGHARGGGMFDFWEICTCPSALLRKLEAWIARHLGGEEPYTGMLNIETIGDMLIECHLRMGDVLRTGDVGFLESVVRLYEDTTWTYNKPMPPYYLFAIFAPWDTEYAIDPLFAESLRRQCTFCRIERSPGSPPGGVRLALFGTGDLAQGINIRRLFIEHLQPALPRSYIDGLLGMDDGSIMDDSAAASMKKAPARASV